MMMPDEVAMNNIMASAVGPDGAVPALGGKLSKKDKRMAKISAQKQQNTKEIKQEENMEDEEDEDEEKIDEAPVVDDDTVDEDEMVDGEATDLDPLKCL